MVCDKVDLEINLTSKIVFQIFLDLSMAVNFHHTLSNTYIT